VTPVARDVALLNVSEVTALGYNAEARRKFVPNPFARAMP